MKRFTLQRTVELDRIVLEHSESTVGGVFSRAEWNTNGYNGTQLRHGLDTGAFTRLRKGWFALEGADRRAMRAVRLDARLSCADAIRVHGGWDLHTGEPHFRIAKGQAEQCRTSSETAREPQASGIVWHRSLRQRTLSKSAVDDLELATECAIRCLPEHEPVPAIDSLLHRRLLSTHVLRRLATQMPSRTREKLRHVDGRSMSGTESIVRLWLIQRGHRVTPQAYFEGVGYVDLLVDGWLVIECDSRLWHTSPANYAADRARDLVVQARGPVVVRLSHEQVTRDWPHTERLLTQICERGRPGR